MSQDRPFYARHAEASDLLVTDPVEPWVEAVHERLVGAGRADAVLNRFAAGLRAGGLLFLDVREEGGSRERADGAPRSRTVRLDPDTQLDFTGTVTWHAGLLHLHEQYALRRGRQPAVESTYDFDMRPWTEDELVRRLSAAGFHDTEIGSGVGRKTPDRLFVVATR